MKSKHFFHINATSVVKAVIFVITPVIAVALIYVISLQPKNSSVNASGFLRPTDDPSWPQLLDVSYNTATAHPGLVIKVAGKTISPAYDPARMYHRTYTEFYAADGFVTKTDGTTTPWTKELKGGFNRGTEKLDVANNTITLTDGTKLMKVVLNVIKGRNVVTLEGKMINTSTNVTLTKAQLRLSALNTPNRYPSKGVNNDNPLVLQNWAKYGDTPETTQVALFVTNNDKNPGPSFIGREETYGGSTVIRFIDQPKWDPAQRWSLAPGAEMPISISIAVGPGPDKNSREAVVWPHYENYLTTHPFTNPIVPEKFEFTGLSFIGNPRAITTANPWGYGPENYRGDPNTPEGLAELKAYYLRQADTIIANIKALGGKRVMAYDWSNGSQKGGYHTCSVMSIPMKSILPDLVKKYYDNGIVVDALIRANPVTKVSESRIFYGDIKNFNEMIDNLKRETQCWYAATGQSDMRFYWDSSPWQSLTRLKLIQASVLDPNGKPAKLMPEDGTHTKWPDYYNAMTTPLVVDRVGPVYQDPIAFKMYPNASQFDLANDWINSRTDAQLCRFAQGLAKGQRILALNAWYGNINTGHLAIAKKTLDMARKFDSTGSCT